MKYDFLIIGAGFYGSVCARELTDKGYKCLVVEKRDHIGGNCYTEEIEGIHVSKYGAHIFHTSNKKVWEYINRFTTFNNYRHHVIAKYQDELYSLPFNMWTFNKLWGVNTPKEAKDIIDSQKFIGEPQNLEEQAIANIGEEIYEKLIKGYTKKQWLKDPKDLPSSIIKRLPVRYTYDNNYFFDDYQGMPTEGFTKIFEKMLDGIDIKLNTDFFENKESLKSLAQNIIFTGQIDKFYDYKFGDLEYRPLEFEHETLDIDNYQGHSVVNYTEESVPYTRIIEHKHFYKNNSNKTIITKEYPVEWNKGDEPYYPINDKQNQDLYNKYLELSKLETNVYFGGRLAEYKYYDMHQVIESALNFTESFDTKNE
jgi:UDP-galactopyranose mutase